MTRKYIGLREADFNQLSSLKTAYENKNGSSTDWGAFLLLLLGIAAGAAIVQQWLDNQKNTPGERR
jgi:hypothetical protein